MARLTVKTAKSEELMGRYCKLVACPRFFVTIDWDKEYCSKACEAIDAINKQIKEDNGSNG